MFKHTIFSEAVVINKPAEHVWHTLLDAENYPLWNPFTYRVLGTIEPGQSVELHVRLGKREQISTETVHCVDLHETLSWGLNLGSRLLLSARRDQKLEVLSPERCSYQTWDAFSGLLTPLVIAVHGKNMLNGFNLMAQALKTYCETND